MHDWRGRPAVEPEELRWATVRCFEDGERATDNNNGDDDESVPPGGRIGRLWTAVLQLVTGPG